MPDFGDFRLNDIHDKIEISKETSVEITYGGGVKRINIFKYIFNRVLEFFNLSNASNPKNLNSLKAIWINDFIKLGEDVLNKQGNLDKNDKIVKVSQDVQIAIQDTILDLKKIRFQQTSAELEAKLQDPLNYNSARIIQILENLLRHPEPVPKRIIENYFNAFFKTISKAYESNEVERRENPEKENEVYGILEKAFLGVMNTGISYSKIFLGQIPPEGKKLIKKYNLDIAAAVDFIATSERARNSGVDPLLVNPESTPQVHGLVDLTRETERIKKLVGPADEDEDIYYVPNSFPREYLISGDFSENRVLVKAESEKKLDQKRGVEDRGN